MSGMWRKGKKEGNKSTLKVTNLFPAGWRWSHISPWSDGPVLFSAGGTAPRSVWSPAACGWWSPSAGPKRWTASSWSHWSKKTHLLKRYRLWARKKYLELNYWMFYGGGVTLVWQKGINILGNQFVKVSQTSPQRCFVSRAGERGCRKTSGRHPTWNHLALSPQTGGEQRGLCGKIGRGKKKMNNGISMKCKFWQCKTVSVKCILVSTTDIQHIQTLALLLNCHNTLVSNYEAVWIL